MTTPQPGWYPDQANPQLVRWWDGTTWTQHTQPNPQQAPQQPQQPQQPAQPQQPVQPQQGYQGYQQPHQQPQGYQQPAQHAGAQHAGAAGFAGGQAAGFSGPQASPGMGAGPAAAAPMGGGQVGNGPLYTEQALLVAQSARVFGVQAAGYKVMDQQGTQIGSFQQVDQSGAKKALRVLSNTARDWMTKHYELRDAQDTPVLQIKQPQNLKTNFKPKFEVMRAGGAPLGELQSEKVVGRITFSFNANGVRIGGFEAEGWGGRTFVVTDQSGAKIAEYVRRASFEKKFKEVFTQEDSYVLMRPQPIPEPLGSFALLGLLALDAGFFDAMGGGREVRWGKGWGG